MLIRRQIRKRLINGLGLRNENVVSHTNGSITIAVRGFTADQVSQRCHEVFSLWGYDDMQELRRGVRRNVGYVTFTNERLCDEAENRYGHSVRQYLGDAQHQTEVLVSVGSQVVEIPEDEIDFDAITLAVAGLELEASER